MYCAADHTLAPQMVSWRPFVAQGDQLHTTTIDGPGRPCMYVTADIVKGGLYVTGSEKTDHFVIMQFVQYGPKALPRSQSRDFAISMPR